MKKLICSLCFSLITLTIALAQAGLAEHNRVRAEAGEIEFTTIQLQPTYDKNGNQNGLKQVKVTLKEVPSPLVWDTNLAKGAQTWAEVIKNGNIRHDPKGGWENIYAGSPNAVDGVKAWETEKQAFNGAGGYNGCDYYKDKQVYNTCGHYKNIIDPTLKKVGCAVAGDKVVCKYSN